MKRRAPGGPAAFSALLAALLWAAAAPRTALALGPFEKNHPRVEEGIRAYGEGRFEDALAAFEATRKEMPDSAAVEFNRGNALYKLRRLKEAQEAYQRVTELDRGQLQQKDYYNLGNAFAELGQQKDAIAAYRKALLLDPGDDLARHNLEVMLRKLPPPKPPKPPDQDRSDGGSDGGSDAGTPDGGRGGGGSGDGGSDGGAGGGGGGPRADGGTAAEPPPDEGMDGGDRTGEDSEDEGGRDAGTEQSPAQELNRKDVERLLDSMRQSEKNLQLWRFQQRKKDSRSRKDNAKDW